jgi:hypothetical protein
MYSNLIKLTWIALLIGIALFAFSGQGTVQAFVAPTATNTTSPTIESAAPVTATATLTPTATTAPSATATTAKPTATATHTATATNVPPTSTATPTAKPATTATPTMQASATTTLTAQATATVTPTVKSTATVTPTAKATATVTPTKTATPQPTATPKTPARALSPSAGTVSSISTAFVVQNMDPSVTANISATFYDTAGTATGPITANVAPYRNVMIDQRVSGGIPGSPSTYQGSVVLSSNTQLAAVVNEYGGTSSSATGFRYDVYNGTPAGNADTTALLPQVLKNVTDVAQNVTYNSLIAIQNTNSSVSANVTITYTNLVGGPVNYTRPSIVIPPNSSFFLDMQNEVSQWPIFFGPARISADQNITVLVNQNAAGALLVYRGFTSADGSNSIIVTQGLTNIYDSGQQLNYGSAVEGMTVDGSSVAVTVQFNNLSNGATSTCTFPTGSTFRVDLRYQYRSQQSCPPPLNGANQFFGSMKFTTSGTPIIALSNITSDASSKGIRVSTSRAFVASGPSGAMTAYVPMLANNYLDSGTGVAWGTALEGKLLSGTGETVNITYYPISGGTPITDTYTAGSNLIFRWDQRFPLNWNPSASLAPGLYSAVITSTSSPFVFTVNNQGPSSALGDALGTYMSK